MSSEQEPPKRKKPSKKKRAPQDDSSTVSSVPKGRQEKNAQILKDTVDPRQRLRDKIKAMQKDRARGSTACEENANHEY